MSQTCDDLSELFIVFVEIVRFESQKRDNINNVVELQMLIYAGVKSKRPRITLLGRGGNIQEPRSIRVKH